MQAKRQETPEELGLRKKTRPIRPGLSVGTVDRRGTGTICCIVQDTKGIKYVLTDVGSFHGTIVIQLGPIDGGNFSDQIGVLERKFEPRPYELNQATGAIARLAENVDVSQEIPGVGAIDAIAEAVKPDDPVRLVGRTSGLARGKVIKTATTEQIGGYGSLPVSFEGLIETDKISDSGDSGAPVLTEDNKLIGMVIAGSPTTTIIMPIRPILQALNVELLH